ncbi:RNA-directed DNA polymerase, eukaryota, reverse transcriptase zinc-binding domain protein [Tanacetum coccineum]
MSEKSDTCQEVRANGNKDDNEGFVEVKNRRNNQRRKVGMNNGTQGNKQGFKVNDEEVERNVCQDDRLIVDRIILGWNPKLIIVLMINKSYQNILCIVELIPHKIRFYCIIVYASNNGTERRSLWKELIMQKQIVKNDPWVIIGDFNVTLCAFELSSRSLGKTVDMVEFNDTINSLEVEDICSSGFEFIWTKSLKNPQCKILKKLDRILINYEFMKRFQGTHGVFLHYMVSDHSHVVLHIKNGFPKKKSSFKFSNFVADKAEFLNLVKEACNEDIHGCYMFKLKSAQAIVDKNPHDERLRKEAIRKVDNVKGIDESIFKNTLSREEVDSMIGEVSDKDIKEAMFDIDSNKASGPDGNRESIEVVKKSLEEFSQVFGLVPNLGKSIMFFGNGDVMLSNEEDKVLWVTNTGDKVYFNTKQAWVDLRVNWPNVNWSHIVWFYQLIPSDSIHHLFFLCDIPKNLWSKMNNLSFKMDMNFKLYDVVDSLARRKGKNNIGCLEKCIAWSKQYITKEDRMAMGYDLHADARICSAIDIMGAG